MTKFAGKVLFDRVLVKPVDRAEQDIGGIFVLTNSVGEHAYVAEVVAVGDGKPGVDVALHPLRVRVGDHVVLEVGPLGVKAGVGVLLGGVAHRVVRESDILVVL